MLKALLLVLALSPLNALAQSKVIHDPKFRILMTALDHQEFNTAFDMASQLLNTSAAEDEYVPLLRYLYMESAAAKASTGAMSRKVLDEKLSTLIGKPMESLPREVARSCGIGDFNIICKGERDTLFASLASNDGTTTYVFEHYKGVNESNYALILGRAIILGGTLDSIEINPNDSGLWVVRATFKDVAAFNPPGG